MRISDWSSDVCSSDLQLRPGFRSDRELGRRLLAVQLGDAVAPELWPLHRHPGEGGRDNRAPVQGAGGRRRHAGGRPTLSSWRGGRGAPRAGGPPPPRLHPPPDGIGTMTDFRNTKIVVQGKSEAERGDLAGRHTKK